MPRCSSCIAMAEQLAKTEKSLSHALTLLRGAIEKHSVSSDDEARMAELARMTLEEDDDGHETEAIESSSATSN